MVVSQVPSYISSCENVQYLPQGGEFLNGVIDYVSNRIFLGVLDGLSVTAGPYAGACSHYGPLADKTPSGWVELCWCFPGGCYHG